MNLWFLIYFLWLKNLERSSRLVTEQSIAHVPRELVIDSSELSVTVKMDCTDLQRKNYEG